MSIEEMKKEHRSVHAPQTALTEAVSRYDAYQAKRGYGGFQRLAWSFAVIFLVSIAILPMLMKSSPVGDLSSELSLTGLTIPVGPAMPSLTNLSTPTNAGFADLQLNHITLLPTYPSNSKVEMETI